MTAEEKRAARAKRVREYHAAHPEVRRSRDRARHAADPEKRRNAERAERRADPGPIRAKERASYYRRRPGVLMTRKGHPSSTAQMLWDRQGGRCGLTGRELDPLTMQLDHIVPRVRGGGDDLENLRWLSREANQAKRDLLDDEFLDLCAEALMFAAGES